MINDLLDELVKDVVTSKNLDKKYLKSKGNANGFEDLFKDKIIDKFNCNHYNDHIHLKSNFGKIFPDMDLIVNKEIYGVELKSRRDGSWATQGGSVFETTSQNPYKEIYVLFGSFDNKKGETSYKARWAPYWQVANAVKVTHSPRFHIDLDSNDPVFTSNQEYKEFREKDRLEQIKIIQHILATNATKIEWYVNPENTLTPSSFSALNKDEFNRIYTESLFLFPKDFLKLPHGNYENVTKYLLSKYFLVSPNMRDKYTAGGTLKINNIKFPHIIKKYQDYHSQIIELVKSNNKVLFDQAYTFWNIKNTPLSDPLTDFKNIIDQIGDQYYKDKLNKAGYQHLSDLIF